MGGVNPNRLRAGALAWLLTLQFFVVEAVAQARYQGPYSRADDVISALGATTSAAHRLMNASFLVQGLLIVAGALLLRPALRGLGARVAPVLLGLSGVGVILVGIFPEDSYSTAHAVGAVLYLLGSGLGLIALAYAVRPRSEAVGTTLALLGLVGTATTVFFVAGVTGILGRGGTERAAAYVLPIGLALAGAFLWRAGSAPDAVAAGTDGATSGRAARQEERERAREQARLERAESARARDEALEAAARRRAAGTGTVDDSPDGSAEDDAGDPWASFGRRRD
jgi:hypothetical membrane protein